MLLARNVSKSFDKPVLTNFSFDFPQTGTVLIRGASGCGKTTLLRILAGLEKQDTGEICASRDIRISCVFQEARLVPHLSVLGNLLLVRDTKDKTKALAILKELGLEQDAHKFPHQLSGGMRLRVAIARSLYYGGNVFLWDEPTKELDPENRVKIRDIIQRLSQNACVIVVTHDSDLTGSTEINL